ncbi:hypothetical protein GC167_06590 [bacterium]|nr:hypothetical protein [bacterium]
MSFGNPAVLWGLLALAFPIALHLFRFRPRKTLTFSDLRFLESAQSRSSSRQKLLERLLLAARLLLFTALIAGFARPRWNTTSDPKAARRGVWILFDTSPSLKAGRNGNRSFDLGKESLRQRLALLPPETPVVLWTPSEGRSPEWNSQEVLQFLDELEPGKWSCDASMLWEQARQIPAEYDVWLVSDFQTPYAGFDATEAETQGKRTDSTIPAPPSPRWEALWIRDERWSELPYIDSLWLGRPFLKSGLAQELRCSIRNPSKRMERLELQALVEAKTLGVFSLELPPGGDSVLSIRFSVPDTTVALGSVSVRFTGTDAGATGPGFEQGFALNMGPTPIVGVVGGAESWKRLLPAPEFDVRLFASGLGPGALECSVLILDNLSSFESGDAEALSQFVESGGQLMVFPPSAQREFEGLNAWLERAWKFGWSATPDTQKGRWEGLVLDHPIWQGSFEELPRQADLPINQKSHSLVGQGFTVAARTALGAPLVVQSPHMVVLGTRPEREWSSLDRHPLWVPLVLNAIFSQSNNLPLYLSAHRPVLWVPRRSAQGDWGWEENGQRTVPEQRVERGRVRIALETLPADGVPRVLKSETEVLGAIGVYPDRNERSRSTLSRSSFPENVDVVALDAASPSADWMARENPTAGDSGLGSWFWTAAIVLALIEALLFRFDPFRQPAQTKSGTVGGMSSQ